MTEAPAGSGGFGRGRGPRGRGRGRGRSDDKDKWCPVTKLGRLVEAQKINSLEDIFLFSLPIKEHQIIDAFIPKEKLLEEKMANFSVQKATSAGQRTRQKAFYVVGDKDGHIGVGARVAKEMPLAIRSAQIAAKLNIVPVRRGYWGNKIGLPHTVPVKVTGKCGSVAVRLVPAPRGTGIVASPVPTKLIQLAGIEDVYSSSKGKTRTTGNFIMATFLALRKTYGFLTPDLWARTDPTRDPTDEHSNFLAQKAS